MLHNSLKHLVTLCFFYYFFYIFSNIYPSFKAVPNISDFSPVEASHANSGIYLSVHSSPSITRLLDEACHMRKKCVMKSAQYIYAAQKVNHYMAWWKFQLTRYPSQENCIITSTNTSFWVTAIATPRADSRFPNWSGQHLGYIFLTHHPPLASWCEP